MFSFGFRDIHAYLADKYSVSDKYSVFDRSYVVPVCQDSAFCQRPTNECDFGVEARSPTDVIVRRNGAFVCILCRWSVKKKSDVGVEPEGGPHLT